MQQFNQSKISEEESLLKDGRAFLKRELEKMSSKERIVKEKIHKDKQGNHYAIFLTVGGGETDDPAHYVGNYGVSEVRLSDFGENSGLIDFSDFDTRREALEYYNSIRS